MYDGEKWEYDFDPDINRFARLTDMLFDLADFDSDTGTVQIGIGQIGIVQIGTGQIGTVQIGTGQVEEMPPKVDLGRSMNSLLASLAAG